ncbi:hypothetical protein O9K51_02277 [Purpureocillium lavendulum]|uniref:Uncharacterized protein n=1 Tax=Purpureocillium lavendulum TaxID=1247861 RepID=A0AB34FZ23_9HYPO|nr:hypothetical protein O9K51_02277 [Purpureocillium lavendulum]
MNINALACLVITQRRVLPSQERQEGSSIGSAFRKGRHWMPTERYRFEATRQSRSGAPPNCQGDVRSLGVGIDNLAQYGNDEVHFCPVEPVRMVEGLQRHRGYGADTATMSHTSTDDSFPPVWSAVGNASQSR